jgi:hypothetical protein
MTAHQLYTLPADEVAALNLCMLNYACSQTFYQTSSPIPDMVLRVRAALLDHDVIFLTARHGIDSVGRYVAKFRRHGMRILPEQVIFAGRWSSGQRTSTTSSEDKAVHFEQILATSSGKYDHIVVYDDSSRNLDAFHQIALDFPFVTLDLRLVDDSGKVVKYHPKI